MQLLIIGCGRSGTTYATEVLRVAGINAGHEEWGDDAKVDSKSIMHKDDLHRAECIFHQVRYPLAVISSLHTASYNSWRRVMNTLNLSYNDTFLFNAMKYWLHWNEMCEPWAEFTYRVENMTSVISQILSRVNIQCDFQTTENIKSIEATINTRREQRYQEYAYIDWNVLMNTDRKLGHHIYCKARGYGYVE